VYVQPFPATGTKYQISRSDEAGHHPVWSPYGKELSYIPQAGQLVSVRVNTQPSFSFGNPVPIPRAFNFGNSPADVRSHDITRDGKRFLALTFAGPDADGCWTSSADPRGPELVRGAEAARAGQMS
jgi:hypothetical protein